MSDGSSGKPQPDAPRGSSASATEPSVSPTGRDTYRELFERSADAILIIEGDRFVDANQAAVEMLRYGSREEVLQTHPSELSPACQPDGRPSYEKANEMIALAFEQGSHRFEWMHRRADGEVFPVEVLLTAVEGEAGRSLHVVWRDISERKRLEAQLRQTSKMEAIGRLAGGIAHDFNNLLVGVLGNADLLARDLGEEAAGQEYLEGIIESADRAADLVRQLLAFSRKQELQPRNLELSAVVRGLEQFLRRLLGEAIRLEIRYPEARVLVRGDPGQIEQVVINLCTNARDAMQEGGVLEVSIGELELGEARTLSSGSLPAGHYARLKVRDQGRGMDDETLGRAFEPFFTTKEVGQGTGLGLATVYGIVKQAQGAIAIESAPGEGTRVSVFLPVLPAGSVVQPGAIQPAAVEQAPAGQETILVVEDEPVVSNLAVKILSRAGYRVLVARDGVDALAAWRDFHAENPGRCVDLLFTDVVMPRMGGPALVQALAEEGRLPRVLFASGYTAELLADLRDGPLEIDLLEKPFSGERLLARVRAALERPPPGGA
ncbi:MAG: ATP-binding protein [Deltaproteobacteria bacterium]|nr:ATP-binding protein [Deltaproteobacteria bacterium]